MRLLRADETVEPWRIALFEQCGELLVEAVPLQERPDEIVCACEGLTRGRIAVLVPACADRAAIGAACGATTVCGGCGPLVDEIAGQGSMTAAELLGVERHAARSEAERVRLQAADVAGTARSLPTDAERSAMTDLRLRRSVLYMPGSNQRALDKAKALPADALILDLEDAVGMEEKELAREQVCAAVKGGGYGHRELIVRVNAPQTPWGEADLRAAIQARPDAILMPKVNSPAILESIADHLEALDAPEDVAVWAMIETPAAILNIAEIAKARRDRRTRLTCFVLGTNDLAKDTWAQIVRGRVPMLPWMMLALAAARAEGLTILDGVWNDIGDVEGCREECRQARDLGFDGKTLIHPNQLEPANTAFAPTEDEIRRAKLVIEAFRKPENAKRAAIKVENRLYERQHLGMATRAVAWSEAIAERDAGSRAAAQ